ncbi:hypothetical protein A2276_00465 [candidate division WOR-1 bacterium RIFOXYA12_FULL_43_27]|uniref:Uncharacterized protein n=1 Tax=candidate division WOR-1 bacterium RIFOXYC2_FULL_46_14 TaxID=1802587 RepID=A0A1F4U4E3_UNCSA|nr:MAG: hypothetical protein A2276_00465 [candidate division WOR-1 bacterium RIFOXYA12_FULL_43_27]OGC20835.1 MAG: hypothetical protein A2292_07410 [candidate division WOR-1 bacterium RIFOXYB2_FULL_46_45]OGC31428.1 MAG: hypothetical protein A2232_04040 [candidate division WOR-1 bacterium RIFOXYA2_FULL_46_56]OGC39834.1 MAG: hypothetical protein A2438_04875 [candidate division WOR-1 bacterium RIFOXYC2_FULL_46_14]
MNNTKAIEVISKTGMLNYLECLVNTQLKKIALYPVFPITAAPNWSNKIEFVMVNPAPLAKLLESALN